MESIVSRDRFGRLIVDDHVINSFDIVPNTFEDMRLMDVEGVVSVRLFNIKSPTIKLDETFNLTMKSFDKEEAFLLVFGGWIPCAFIKRNTIILIDRNIVSEIVGRYKGGQKKKNTPMDAFDEIFLSNRYNVDITAFVLEGNKRRIPSDDEIDEQIKDVTKSLNFAIPNLNIVKYPNENNYYYAFRDKLADTIGKRMEFFRAIAPKLNKQFNEKSRELAVAQIFESVKEIKIDNKDVSVLLALLRISMIGKKTAAQLVLKDSQVYSEEHAYNTVCDLVAMELLTNLHNVHVKKKSLYNIAFITKDKGLSLFASLLSDANVAGSDGNRISVTSRISSAIFGDDPVIIKIYEDWAGGKY